LHTIPADAADHPAAVRPLLSQFKRDHHAMLDQLRVHFFRWAIRVFLYFKWRGRKAVPAAVANEAMPVAGGRVRVRVYTPAGSGPHPILHFFHGGGWVGGDLESHDALCRDLCVRSGHLVVAFDYRLAPEHPFPIPVEDCLASLSWIRQNAQRLSGDIGRLVLFGDSAGGNLAAVVAQQARRLFPGLIKGQVLVYPVLDHCEFAQWDSYRTKGGKGYGLTHTSMKRLWRLYLEGSTVWKGTGPEHELATPLLVKDLGGLPRTLLVLAEDDMLFDEGCEYGRRLELAGTQVSIKRCPGQQHGFFGLEPSTAHKEAVQMVSDWLLQPTQPHTSKQRESSI
jgi:acetyl esterase/lipase